MNLSILVILLNILFSITTPATVTDQGDLVIEVQNLQNIKGHVLIGLYNSPIGFPDADDKTFKWEKMPVSGKESINIVFKNIPFDTYAFALLLDEDGDDKMDKNFLGIPREGFALSNNIKPKISAPDFDECSFQLDSKRKYMKVKLIYY